MACTALHHRLAPKLLRESIINNTKILRKHYGIRLCPSVINIKTNNGRIPPISLQLMLKAVQR